MKSMKKKDPHALVCRSRFRTHWYIEPNGRAFYKICCSIYGPAIGMDRESLNLSLAYFFLELAKKLGVSTIIYH